MVNVDYSNPRAYWTERAATQGPSYVGPAGRPELSAEQYAAIAPEVEKRVPADVDRVLDFGCGSGRFTELLAARARWYVGCDIVDQHPLYEDWPSNAIFWHMQHAALPWPEATFDVVFCGTVLQHIVDDEWFAHWCAIIRRVLKPGGHLIVWDHCPGDGHWEHMNPRGSPAISSATGCGAFVDVAEVDGHWIGVARRVGR